MSGEVQQLQNSCRHVAFGDVSSTNTIALEYARNNDPGKLWITALRQSKGRGSRGREWVSDSGNLYCSLLLRLNLAPEIISQLTFVASLALFSTLEKFIKREELALKWPNDVLARNAKISGILLENHPLHTQHSAVIIGLGVNCNSNPQATDHKATNLAALGIETEPQLVFAVLVDEMHDWLKLWQEGANFSNLLGEWRALATGIGENINVKMPGSELCGIFEDIDESGRLILKTPDDRRHKISTADIFFSNHQKKGA